MAAALLRLPGLFNELWFDEVFSLSNVSHLSSWLGIVTELRTDNNHHLVSLWMRLLGSDATPVAYRVLPFACGVGAVIVGVAGSWRDGARTALVVGALLALSFPLVYYSSEARGYAPVALFTLCAWFSLRAYADDDRLRDAGLFWASSILGLLSHQTFLFFFIAAAVWCDTHVQRGRRGAALRNATRRTMTAFVPAGLAFVAWYIVALRGTAIFGGPRSNPFVVIAETLSLLGSGPPHGPVVWLFGGAVAVLFAAGLIGLYRRGDDRWLLYGLVGMVIPVTVAAALVSVLYARYFTVPGVFVLLAMADALSSQFGRGGWRRAAASIAIAAVGAGTLVQLGPVYRLGRGRYNLALERMLTAGNGPVTVASLPEYTLHDTRIGLQVEYLARRLRATDRVHYVSEEAYSAAGTAWMIREAIGNAPADAEIRDRFGNRFVLDGVYRSAPLAGLAWHAYRRGDEAAR